MENIACGFAQGDPGACYEGIVRGESQLVVRCDLRGIYVGLLHSLRLRAQSLGIDVLRYPVSDPNFKISQFLRAGDFEVVVDVGANDGGFGLSITSLGFEGDIWSFEPLSAPYERLRSLAARRAGWNVRQLALGDREGTIDINVAGNSEASSSVLPMLRAHVDAAPESAYVGSESVVQTTIDRFMASEGIDRRTYLKIDVQGYEQAVLVGAEESIASSVKAIQLECSMVPLYEGAWTWRDALDWLAVRGFEVAIVLPGFTDMRNGRVLQCDFVLARE